MDPVVVHTGILKYVYWFSDLNLLGILQIIKNEFSIMALLFGGAFLMVLKKWTDWTPWPQDNQLLTMIAERVGLNPSSEDKK